MLCIINNVIYNILCNVSYKDPFHTREDFGGRYRKVKLADGKEKSVPIKVAHFVDKEAAFNKFKQSKYRMRFRTYNFF